MNVASPHLNALLEAQNRFNQVSRELAEAEDKARSLRIQLRAAEAEYQRALATVDAGLGRDASPSEERDALSPPAPLVLRVVEGSSPRRARWAPGLPLPAEFAEVLAALNDEGVPFAALREKLDLDKRTLRARVGSLKRWGLAESCAWGVYRTTEQGRQALLQQKA